MCTNAWCMMWCPFFSEPTLKKDYCSVELTDTKYKAFVYAIDNHYWYQMYIGKCLQCFYNQMFVLYTILYINLLFVLHNYEHY